MLKQSRKKTKLGRAKENKMKKMTEDETKNFIYAKLKELKDTEFAAVLRDAIFYAKGNWDIISDSILHNMPEVEKK